MNKNNLILLLATAITIAACSEKPHQTVSYYEAHDAERTEMVKWCNDDSSRAMEPDCLNANKAQSRHMNSGKTPSAADTFKYDPNKKLN